MSDLRCMSFFRVTPCRSNHPGTPSHAVGIWVERFEQRAHPVGLASGEQRWEIWFFCKSYPEKMAMAARHTEGQWTPEVSRCRLPQRVSDSLPVLIWVRQVILFRPCKGLKEGVSALAELPTPRKRLWQRPQRGTWGLQISCNGFSGCKRGGLCATPPMKWYKLMVTGWVGGGVAHRGTCEHLESYTPGLWRYIPVHTGMYRYVR